VTKLKFYRFDLNEFIYKKNESAAEMYFIVKGEVSLLVLTKQKKEFCAYVTVSEGYHFGEIDLLLNDKRLRKEFARSNKRCEILALLYEDLDALLQKYEEIAEELFLETL
jgi:CRP-like cAMP-binding protein